MDAGCRFAGYGRRPRKLSGPECRQEILLHVDGEQRFEMLRRHLYGRPAAFDLERGIVGRRGVVPGNVPPISRSRHFFEAVNRARVDVGKAIDGGRPGRLERCHEGSPRGLAHFQIFLRQQRSCFGREFLKLAAKPVHGRVQEPGRSVAIVMSQFQQINRCESGIDKFRLPSGDERRNRLARHAKRHGLGAGPDPPIAAAMFHLKDRHRSFRMCPESIRHFELMRP